MRFSFIGKLNRYFCPVITFCELIDSVGNEAFAILISSKKLSFEGILILLLLFGYNHVSGLGSHQQALNLIFVLLCNNNLNIFLNILFF